MKVLWATKKGDPSWKEQLITEVEARIPEAKKWAKKNGFDRFRVSDVADNEKPDFRKALKL